MKTSCAEAEQKLPGNYDHVVHRLHATASIGRPRTEARRQWVRAATQC